MFYWPVSLESLKAMRRKVPPSGIYNPSSLVQASMKAYVDRLCMQSRKEDSTEELERLPTHFIIDALEEMCNHSNLGWLQRKLLTKPRIISRILQDRERNQYRLAKCLQWLELFDKCIVSDMVANYCYRFWKKPKRDDLHPLGYEATLRIGTFLSETGWHEEASKVLNIARQQAKHRPMEQLRAIRPQLISQAYMWHHCAFETSIATQTLIVSNTDLPKPFLASLYLAISIYQYENCSFESSHTFALKAFELLDDKTASNRLIIEVFSHLAKTCVSREQNRQAKLMITQAVSRAWHNFGPCSAIYAETLENYAIYLVMMNSLHDSYKVFSEAVHVLLQVYGAQNIQRSVTKGSLSFDFYFNCAFIYTDLNMAKNYIRTQTKQTKLDARDKRLVMAARRVYALLESTTGRFGLADTDFPRDEYQPIQNQQSVAEARKLFDQFHHTVDDTC